ncbi:MAG: EAL domain-containing protein [Candidatus Thiodiazotropha sp. (ex Epidulcina cf. delphinae)]|nr:EAL domain-containing protein [Candidatus Thiodiazotropha sp. (ex Epidulcina cf. delphinae)]
MPLRLQTKLLLWLLPFVIVPLLGFGWSNYLNSRKEIRNAVGMELDAALNLLNIRFETLLQSGTTSLMQLQASSLVRRYTDESDESIRLYLLQTSVMDLLRTHLKTYKDFDEIYYARPGGEIEIQAKVSGLSLAGPEQLTPEVLSVLEKFSQVRIAHIGSVDNVPTLVLGLRLGYVSRSRDPASRIWTDSGYLIIHLNLTEMIRDLNRFASRFGYIALMDKEGESYYKYGSYSDDIESSWLEATQWLSQGFQLRAGVNADVVEAPLQKAFAETLLVTLAAAILAGIVLFLALRWLVVIPIRILTEATEVIGEGNLGVEVPYHSTDELGKLADSVRSMAKDLRSSKEDVEYMAYHDQLTGLPNRRMFREMLDQAILRAQRHDESLAMLFLDLDDFKRVNDVYGHAVGDELLRGYTHRLESCLRQTDKIARPILSRMGGDEFLILLESISGADGTGKVAERILQDLKQPLIVGGRKHHVTVSIGITLYPDDGYVPDELIRQADMAMYLAKAQGKGAYRFFSDSLNRRAVRRAELSDELRHAIDQDEFYLVYQPQVELATSRLIGVEALLRWESDALGAVPPAEFIPVAEESRLIEGIGAWVLQRVSEQAKAWRNKGLPNFTISINVSSLQLHSLQAVEKLKTAIQSAAKEDIQFELELTETALMSSPAEMSEILRGLHGCGARISLDDFGTGYSSLTYLRRLAINTLKIDSSFVSDIPQDQDAVAIVRAVVAMGQSLGLRVIAEGVEEPAQGRFLSRLGCDAAQGYLCGKPMSPDQITERFIQGNGLNGTCKQCRACQSVFDQYPGQFAKRP